MTMGKTVVEIRKMLQDADEEEFVALERALKADTRKGVKESIEVCRRRLEARRCEAARVSSLYDFDASFAEGESPVIVAGLDEVGRGAVAGPLAVGAVVLPPEPHIGQLDDSKRLTHEQRTQIAREIKRVALAWAVFYVEPASIDAEGMSASLRTAFFGALEKVEEIAGRVDILLVDGNPLGLDERERNVLKGDSKSACIAAASIVAKVERDALMTRLSSTYPQYGFEQNKGYGVAEHEKAIQAHGICPAHRATFCKSFLQESLF